MTAMTKVAALGKQSEDDVLGTLRCSGAALTDFKHSEFTKSFTMFMWIK